MPTSYLFSFSSSTSAFPPGFFKARKEEEEFEMRWDRKKTYSFLLGR